MARPIQVGAVIYDPKVVAIWETIGSFFEESGCAMETVFFSDYPKQNDALIGGAIDIAWNSPLAWLDALRLAGGKCRAIAMRDTDRDRVSHLLVRKNSGIGHVHGLHGSTVATGALDSPQATLIPINLIANAGLRPGRDFTIRRHDVMIGKHGDHVGGEQDALYSLLRSESDACAVLDMNWDRWRADGTVDPAEVVVLDTTPPFDHCNFTVLESFDPEREKAWTGVLFQMQYENEAHRNMMDMEGLKEWLPGRTSGYHALEEAVARQRYFEEGNR